MTLCTGKQFEEYFSNIEYDKDDKEIFKRVLKIRVDKKDKKKILEARDRENKNLGKPPQYIKQVRTDQDPKRRKKNNEEIVFGMYLSNFHIQLYLLQFYHQMYLILRGTDNTCCLNSVQTVLMGGLLTHLCFDHLSL